MYVCDTNKIIYYHLTFHKDKLEAAEGKDIVNGNGLVCGGLSSDKFGNLYYVDKARQSINRINGRELIEHFKLGNGSLNIGGVMRSSNDGPFLTNRVLYDVASTPSAANLEDIEIEREYLYWTNSASNERHGSIHKAFTEPFGRAVPFQTYDDYQV